MGGLLAKYLTDKNDENRRDYCDCVVCRGEGKEFGLVTIFEFADRQK